MNQTQSNRHKKNTIAAKLFLGCTLLSMSAFLAVVCFTLTPEVPDSTASADITATQTAQTTGSETVSPVTESVAPSEKPTNAPQTDNTTIASTAALSSESNTSYGVFNPSVVTVSSKNWELTLVNTQYRLPANYAPPKLTSVVLDGKKLDSRVATHYMDMYNAAKKENLNLKPYSGYRSYAKQKSNYENKIDYYVNQGYNEKDAAVKAAMWIMPPGSSEHNLGFAMDIVSAEEKFKLTDEFTWLRENAYKYGFIMRYAEEKTDITGVSYEPWHWRYVGVKAATELYKMRNENGVEPCLEEYLGKVN